MSTPFEIESSEESLRSLRNELPDERKYFRGQTQLMCDCFDLKSSLGRYTHLLDKSYAQRDELECGVLEVDRNHLVTQVKHLPRSDWETLAIAQHHRLPTRSMDRATHPPVAHYFAVRETKSNRDGESLNSAVHVLIRYPGLQALGDPVRHVWEDAGQIRCGRPRMRG